MLPHEAHDFTPGLAENLDLLADRLALDRLQPVARELQVDTFSLDILARGSDADGEVTVVIENQYGESRGSDRQEPSGGLGDTPWGGKDPWLHYQAARGTCSWARWCGAHGSHRRWSSDSDDVWDTVDGGTDGMDLLKSRDSR